MACETANVLTSKLRDSRSFARKRSRTPTGIKVYASWGAVQSVKFRRVDELGQDVYDVRQERGLSEWAIYLDDYGVIQDAQHNH